MNREDVRRDAIGGAAGNVAASRRAVGHGLDTSVPAVVLKLDHNVVHHGGLGVIRSLGRAGVPVYVVHEHPFAPAAHSRYVHGRFLWTPDPRCPEQVVAGLARLAERIGRRAVLIPTDDTGAILIAEHAAVLRSWFRFPALAPDLPRRLAGKHTLSRLCRALGLPTAESLLTADLPAAEVFVGKVGLPVVVKLPDPGEFVAGGPRSTTLVRDHEHLAEVFEHAAGAALLLQEHIPARDVGGHAGSASRPPGAGQDWFFHGYRGTGRLVGFTGVKERSYPPHAGLTSFGRWVPNQRLLREVAGLLGRISYHGIMDLDLRYDHRDDRYKLLDFNPRLGAQFRLFADEDGLDVVRAAHLDLTGRPVPAARPVPERRFLVENYDLPAALGYARRGELDLRAWLRSLRGVDEAAWYARDDLAPFGLMCLRTAARLLGRPGRRAAVPTAPRFRPGRADRPFPTPVASTSPEAVAARPERT